MEDRNEKVFHFKDKDPGIRLLHDVIGYLREDKVKEFIMVVTIEGEDQDFILYDWFGSRSTMYILGLLTRMKEIVMQWINERS